MSAYATVDDVTAMWRALTTAETERAETLLPVISDALRQEAINRGKNLDDMIDDGLVMESVLKSVVIDILGRMLNASTEDEAFTQTTQSALGYSVTGTYLTPGGGLFIKNAELARIGLKKQRLGWIDLCSRESQSD